MRKRSSVPVVLLLTLLLILTLALNRAGRAQAVPCPAGDHGAVELEQFASKVFPYPQTLRVWLPPGYHDAGNAGRRYPVLYLFDGQNLYSGCAADGSKQWGVDETLTRLIGEREVAPMIVVGIDAPDDGPKQLAVCRIK